VTFEELARQVRANREASGAEAAGVETLKHSRLRTVVRRGDVVLKVLHRRAAKARREATTLARARARGVAVPELLGAGQGWVATRFVEGRPARRDDLEALLPAVHAMHDRGMLHRDLHLGNILVARGGPIFLDTQKARFLPRVPGFARRWELGFLAHSLGDPLPEALAHVRPWCERRAQRHWRSRTARCTVESSGFTQLVVDGQHGYRRRDVPAARIARALRSAPEADPLKQTERSTLHRTGDWIVKRHQSRREALAAWRGGVGLEVRGIGVARPLAWVDRWLVMEDAGPTLSDWVDDAFGAHVPTTPEATATREAMASALGELLARLHRARIYHPDLKANNVCWLPGTPPRLLDYAHVRFGRRLSERRRAKNLAQLNAALPDVVPSELRERALACYVAGSGFEGAASALRERVIALSLERRHRWSGC